MDAMSFKPHNTFTYELKETNEPEDLELGNIGDGIPSLGGGEAGREGIAVEGHGPGPGDAVGVDDVANKSKHGDAAVLDFGLAEKSNGGLVARAPEVAIGKAKRVVETDGGVQALGKTLKVSLIRYACVWFGQRKRSNDEYN